MNCVRKIIIVFFSILCMLMGARMIYGPLIWQNLTDSGPHGIYIYAPSQKLHCGDWCVVNLPQDVPGLHVAKGYKLIKQVRAISGEYYDVTNDRLIVRQQNYPITRASYLPQLKAGRYVVPDGHYLFLNEPNLSFDSRYLGSIEAKHVQCKVVFIVDYDKINQYLKQVRSWFV